MTTDVSGDHAASSATSSPNSILDRKRELKAIPGSFSYNLGRRGSGLPPRLDLSHGTSPNRSVRSIVAWIESSATSKRASRLSASSDGATLRSRASSYTVGGTVDESPSRRRETNAVGVYTDEDCPTFLDYQRYFSQESLARCLDESPQTAVFGSMPEQKQTGEDMHYREYKERLEKKSEEIFSTERVLNKEKRSSTEVAAL